MTTTDKHRLSVLPYLSKRWEKVGRQMAFKAQTRGQWQRWRKDLAKRLKSITGYDTMTPAPLKPKITETTKHDGYTRQRIEIQTEPGVIMTLYALIPANSGGGPFPVMLCPHGHCSGGKYSPAGRSDLEPIAKAIAEYNYDYGVQYARAGFIAFCPDARGFGERKEPTTAGDYMNSSCLQINQMAYPLGQTVTGMWAWDLHRLIDYVQTRKDCLADKLACGGLSGGGLQTLWAAALDEDERITAAVVSGYFYGYEQSLLQQHTNCSCNYVPHLYETADMGDIGALIAPRPLLIETGDQDPLNGADGLANVTSQVKISRNAYKLLGSPDKLKHVIFHGGHKWYGVETIPWTKQVLGV